MIDATKIESFAFPVVNCAGTEHVNAALKGIAEPAATGSSNSPPAELNSHQGSA